MKRSILYVDDEVDNLYSFQSLFRRDYKIFIAESGAEALQLLEENKVELIISDQRMPEMTGVEFFEAIKDKYPDVIRMVMTGYSDMQAIIDSINKGRIYQYIAKPWEEDELKVIIDNALETYDLRQQITYGLSLRVFWLTPKNSEMILCPSLFLNIEVYQWLN